MFRSIAPHHRARGFAFCSLFIAPHFGLRIIFCLLCCLARWPWVCVFVRLIAPHVRQLVVFRSIYYAARYSRFFVLALLPRKARSVRVCLAACEGRVGFDRRLKFVFWDGREFDSDQTEPATWLKST